MKRATMGVLIASLGASALATVWWTHQPRLAALGEGPVQPLGVSVGKEVPAQYAPWSSLSTPGFSPVRLLFRAPGLPRDASVASDDAWTDPDVPPRGKVAAHLVLPNGSTAPLDVQRSGDRLLVDVRGDIPPALSALVVEVFVPGRPISRFRATNLPTGTVAFDVDRRVTAQGPLSGVAGWEPQEKGSPVPALFWRLSVAGVRASPGEVLDLKNRTEGPFAERGHDPWTRMEGTLGLGASRRTINEWTNTPYAAYAKAVRSRGEVRRYRVFDETIDLGSVALRPRAASGIPSRHDLEPVVPRARTAATPGGLRLTLSPRGTQDNMSFGSGVNVSVPLDVDRASATRGLPPDMARLARRNPVEIAVAPVSKGPDGLLPLYYDPRLREPNTIYPAYVTFDGGSGRPATYSLRLRVRRRVLVEATPYDLTLPVSGPRHEIGYRRGGVGAGGF